MTKNKNLNKIFKNPVKQEDFSTTSKPNSLEEEANENSHKSIDIQASGETVDNSHITIDDLIGKATDFNYRKEVAEKVHINLSETFSGRKNPRKPKNKEEHTYSTGSLINEGALRSLVQDIIISELRSKQVRKIIRDEVEYAISNTILPTK